MGTEVLHPQDCHCFINVDPIIVRKNGNSCRTTTTNKNDYMGSTPITERELQPNCHNGDDSYAGSAFFHSPSPRSLPLPSFFNKKQDSMAMVTDHDAFDDSATKHLCSLLRLG